MYQTQAGLARTAGLNAKRLHFWVKLLIVGNLSSCYNLSKHAVKMLRMQIVISASDRSSTLADLRLILFISIAEILTSNSVGTNCTQCFFPWL